MRIAFLLHSLLNQSTTNFVQIINSLRPIIKVEKIEIFPYFLSHPRDPGGTKLVSAKLCITIKRFVIFSTQLFHHNTHPRRLFIHSSMYQLSRTAQFRQPQKTAEWATTEKRLPPCLRLQSFFRSYQPVGAVFFPHLSSAYRFERDLGVDTADPLVIFRRATGPRELIFSVGWEVNFLLRLDHFLKVHLSLKIAQCLFYIIRGLIRFSSLNGGR